MTKGIKHKDIGEDLSRTEFEADDSHELESGTSFPGSPVEKDRFYRTDLHKWYIYNGTVWQLLAGLDLAEFYDYASDLIAWEYLDNLNSIYWNYSDYEKWAATTLHCPTPTLRTYIYIAGKSGQPFYGRIYRNGSPVGIARATVTGTWYTEDIADWSESDTCELWLHDNGQETGGEAEFKLKGTPKGIFSASKQTE